MLSEVLSNQYETISNYMVSNKLVINDDKTQLLVLGTRVNKAIREQVSMQAGAHTIQPAKTGKLLGCEVSDDLKWTHHILESEQSMIKQLASRINGLALVASRADFRTRLMVANGIVVSKLCYLIQLWGDARVISCTLFRFCRTGQQGQSLDSQVSLQPGASWWPVAC